MTADEFRILALSLPEAVEGAHMGHADFRVCGKIFATLGPAEAWGMVKLTPDQQATFIDANPQVFQAFKGAWGRREHTKLTLEAAGNDNVFPALVAAWRNTAPKRLTR